MPYTSTANLPKQGLIHRLFLCTWSQFVACFGMKSPHPKA
jgi:hypothetical protein